MSEGMANNKFTPWPMTEPAYTEHDLREAQKLHKLWNEEACGFFDGGNMCLDCEVIASELSLIRSEARAGMREACAGHEPTLKMVEGPHIEMKDGKGTIMYLCCSCGFRPTETEDEHWWNRHIRSLPDKAADEAIERIKREARLDEAIYWRTEFDAQQEGKGPWWAMREWLHKRIAALSGKETEHD